MSTAEKLAAELNVSLRTIYRDIKTLNANGVCVRGEAGVGYRLIGGIDYLTPCLTRSELRALELGANLLRTSKDQSTGDTAERALCKLQRQSLLR